MNPIVSTITPCFRMERYLKKFLDELPNQTMFNELQVVLDHNEPTEQELIWVKDFQEKYPGRLKHIITNPVKPIGTSMNTCIKESDGEFLTIWNVDDLRTPNSLEIQVNLLRNTPCDVANGNFVIVPSFGSTVGKFIDHTIYTPKEFLRSMVLGPFFMFRKFLLEKSGMFDEQLKSGADFDLAIRLAVFGKVETTKEILGYYLDEGKGASTNGDGRQPLERTVIELRYGILDKVEQTLMHKALVGYDVRHVVIDGKKIYVGDIIPQYSDLLSTNRKP